MAQAVPTPSGMIDYKKMTAEEFQSLLRQPLGRLRIKTPDIVECQELVIWVNGGPIGPIDRPEYISDKPHRYMTSLKASLAQVEDFYRLMLQQSVEHAPNEEIISKLQEHGEVEVFAPLRRLRAAMEECEALVRQKPVPFKESWEGTAMSLFFVFRWVVGRSGSNARSGLSKGGPSVSFICAGLDLLGWRKGTNPSEDAIVQYLKRNRRDWDK